jgi:hypothetical protein
VTEPSATNTEPTDPRMALIELRHLRAEVARLRQFVAIADGASRAAEHWEAETKRWLAFIERGMETHMRFGVIREDGTREELPCADWCYACRIQTAEAAITRIRHLTADGPPAGTGIGGEWEGGWDSAMEAVHAALTPQESEQKTVTCYCTCPDCWHGCCHIPLRDLTDDDLDELYQRRDLAEATLGRVRARAEQWQAAMGRGEVNPAARQVLDLLDEPHHSGPTEATDAAASNRLRKDLVAALADYSVAAWTPDNLAGRVLRVVQPELDRLSDAEAAVQRVIALYERWSLAGPPLGKSMTGYFQWWREHLAELHAAILPPPNLPKEK